MCRAVNGAADITVFCLCVDLSAQHSRLYSSIYKAIAKIKVGGKVQTTNNKCRTIPAQTAQRMESCILSRESCADVQS